MEKWAILIGVDHYERINDLKYSSHDVSEVKKAFCSTLGFSDDHIIVLSDKSEEIPDRPSIFDALGKLREEQLVKADDLLVFYFSGHGMRDKEKLKDYLLPCGATPKDLELTGVKVADVVDRLKKIGCKNVVMFIDACREPVKGAKGVISIGEDSQKIVSREGVVTFFSCDPTAQSWEIDELEHSSFTWNVLEAIKDSNCNTIDDVDEFLRNHVPLTNRDYKKPVQLPYTIIEPSEKGKLAIFSSLAQLKEAVKTLDKLLDILGERYDEEKLDSHAFSLAVDVVYLAKEKITDERIRRMIKPIEEFCCGNLSGNALKVALDAIKRRQIREPVIQGDLERLK